MWEPQLSQDQARHGLKTVCGPGAVRGLSPFFEGKLKMFKRFVIAAAVAVAVVGGAIAAQARSCQTTCSTVGGYTTCNQNCW